MFRRAASAKASIKGSRLKPNLAKAQAQVEISCGLYSDKELIPAAAIACSNWKSCMDNFAKVHTEFPRFCGKNRSIFAIDSNQGACIKEVSFTLMAARAQWRKTLWIKFSKSSTRLPVKKEYLQLGMIRKDHENDQLRTLQKWLPAKACDKPVEVISPVAFGQPMPRYP